MVIKCRRTRIMVARISTRVSSSLVSIPLASQSYFCFQMKDFVNQILFQKTRLAQKVEKG